MSAADRQPFIVDQQQQQQSSSAVARTVEATASSIKPSTSGSSNSGCSTPNSRSQQPIRMVLKLAQSGAYSPAKDMHSTAASTSEPHNSNGQQRPPTLLPLPDDDEDDEDFDDQQLCSSSSAAGNGSTLRRSSKKKKKKKHHHHHHHHHHHRHHHSREESSTENHHNHQKEEPSTLRDGGSDATTIAASNNTPMLDMSDDAAATFDGVVNHSNLSDGSLNTEAAATFSGALQHSATTVLNSATLNSLAALRNSDVFGDGEDDEDEDDEEGEDEEDEEGDDELGNGLLNNHGQHRRRNKPSNRNILNLIGSDQLMLDGSPHDSIASVDLMDVDSDNLDISCFQATGDSPGDEDDDGGGVNSPADLVGGGGGGHQLRRQPSSQSSSSSSAALKDQLKVPESSHQHLNNNNNNGNNLNNHHLSSLTSKSLPPLVPTSTSATATTAPTQASPPNSNSSLYRRLLQAGITIDSSNVIAYVQTVGGRPATRRAKAWVSFAGELLRRLREKDSRHFFAWPTTELTAPGYSAVVVHPMDWATIEKKITFCLYRSIYEMKVDVRVLCENALRYYRSSGAQYREAARLWAFAKRTVFTRETFTEMLPRFPPLSLDDLGLEALIGEKVSRRRKKKSRRKLNNANANANNKSTAVNGFSGLSSLLSGTASADDDGSLNRSAKREIATPEGEDEEDESNSSSSTTEQPWSREEILRAASKALGGQSEADDLVQLGKADSRWSLVPPPPSRRKRSSHHLSNGHHSATPSVHLLTRQRPDGSTSLPFVVPPTSRPAEPDDPEAAINTIGALVGRLPEGARSVPVPREPDYNRVRVMQLVPEALALPFSSHLPLLGATAGGGSGEGGGGGAGSKGGGGSGLNGGSGTVLSLEESSLLLNADFGGVEEQFAETIQRISEDADYTAIGFVDAMLDIVSGGRYSKEKKERVEKEADTLSQTTAAATAAAEEKEVPMEVSSAADEQQITEQDDGVELLKPAEEEVKAEEEVDVSSEEAQLQQALDETKTLIGELEALQYRRLASAPEPVPPDEKEAALAETVTSKLVSLISSSARPQDVVSLEAIRKSMGVLIPPLKEEEEEEVIDLEEEQSQQQQQQQSSLPL